ncbi:hypothetical protein CEP10_00590 [Cylindrospermopsis raciborskii S07]|uniref:hypothetical protein n=1 Tax=Cylindrospermopsis raciborskii TaxID=77022 RepID=UPI000C9E4FCC|nr:hypothetical protein [Cylindrospermopsis raciborskii]PNK05098.1 hypothetical protein CEP12_11675 [Cylindrospermopsis raciborskii S14]PNK06726.1 hypothetical protein CEP11_06555 [Cylindrospermopsis raciborskii S10]PNK10795.1 hypothetical protein CEP10_00590 [Cylindrospermopsis raciborskii S07]PNK15354.1 hypothetical protein CEP09_10380 [Cylindrospermopsis raciborskii S06]PNK16879.1 hypothetical protein CEP08_10800 [Cylindrospermopsis raciborskii S05]
MTTLAEAHRSQIKTDSVTFIQSFVNKDICFDACKWLEANELNIIEKFQSDKRGLSCNTFNSKPAIKYFEYPLAVNTDLFGKFVTSKLFNAAEFLLGEPVFLRSMEIHSRFPGSEIIPLHQDNAYYGLERGSALTFYIPINSQHPLEGGLRYISTPHGQSYEHQLSNASGFSLTIKTGINWNESCLRDFVYYPGDCSIHNPYSRHYAELTPLSSTRAWVVRFSLYSLSDKVSEGHHEWYQNMIRLNRDLNIAL